MGQFEKEKAHRLLDSVAWMEAKVTRRLNEVEKRRAVVERLNVGTQEMPVMGGVPSSGAEWDVYLSAKEEYERHLKDYIRKKDLVLETLDGMKNVTHARILELRYLNEELMSYRRIGEKMCYSSSQICKLMEKALDEFWEVLTKTKQSETKRHETKQHETKLSKTG